MYGMDLSTYWILTLRLKRFGLAGYSLFFIGLLIENAPASYPSVSQLMAEYRRSWMRHMAARDVRIFDT